MSRYIDIDDISLRKTIACGGLSAKALWRRIQQQPTIDAMSVVRCGECKHMYDGIKGDGYLICHKFNHFIKADDYCSYGERRTDGQDIQSATE